MANAWPASLKPLGKYLARGRECRSDAPIVAYYCNLYSAKEGIRRAAGDPLAEQFVKALLEKCEAEQALVGPDDGGHQATVTAYALARFAAADDEDVAGPTTQATARKYFAAMCYLDVCAVFGPLPDDAAAKKEFAKHRAAAITKAVRECREPEPRAVPAVDPELEPGVPEPSVDPHMPYPQSTLGFPEEPSAPLPTVQYSSADVQGLTGPAWGAAAMSGPAPAYPEPPSEDPRAQAPYACPDSRGSDLPASYPPSESRWTPQMTPPPDPPADPRPDSAAAAFDKLSLGPAAYPEVAPAYMSFEDRAYAQSFKSTSSGVEKPQPPPEQFADRPNPPSRPLPSPPYGQMPHSGKPQPAYTTSVDSSLPSHSAVPSPAPVAPPVQQPSVRQNGRAGFQPSIENMKLAQGYARDAFSALDFPDVDGAVLYLEKALAELKGLK